MLGELFTAIQGEGQVSACFWKDRGGEKPTLPCGPVFVEISLCQTILESLDDGLHLLLAVGELILLLGHGAPLGLVYVLHFAHLASSVAFLVAKGLDLLLALVHLLFQLGLLFQRVVQFALQHLDLPLVRLGRGLCLGQPLPQIVYYDDHLGADSLVALDVW
jgi:hypothetical protein